MGRNRVTQLSFQFVESRESTPSFVPTRALARHRSCNRVLERLGYVRRFFPELGSKSIRIGITRVASGMAVPGGTELWFNPSVISYHTIAHEFVHLLQGQHGIPTGERSCDLFSLARHWTLNDTPPYYLRVPVDFLDLRGHIRPECARILFEAAREALERRNAGLRTYISYFEKKLEARDGRTNLQQLLQPV